jgi:hypothetical protein
MLPNGAVIAFCAAMLVGCSTPSPVAPSHEPPSVSASSVDGAAIDPVEPTASALRRDLLIARAGATTKVLPADCDRAPIAVDTTSIPTTHITRSDAEGRSGGMGDGKPALTAVLGRVTMTNPRTDFRGVAIDARLVWVLGWTGLMHNLPSSGPYVPNAAPRTVQYSTASILVIDALTGDAIIGIACGIVRL